MDSAIFGPGLFAPSTSNAPPPANPDASNGTRRPRRPRREHGGRFGDRGGSESSG
jgi:hypothetical protein